MEADSLVYFKPPGGKISEAEARDRHEANLHYGVCFTDPSPGELLISPALGNVDSNLSVVVSFVQSKRSECPRIVYHYQNTPQPPLHCRSVSAFSQETYRGVSVRKIDIYEDFHTGQWMIQEVDIRLDNELPRPIQIDTSQLETSFPEFGAYDHLLVEHHPVLWPILLEHFPEAGASS